MPGRVIHFEIPFDDKERATSFYRDVFGWQLEDMPGMDYVGVATGPMGEAGPTEAGYIGGGMTHRDGTNTSTVVVMHSDDIDADLAKVTEHGGAVVAEKFPVADMGFAGYFKDPEGNVVGLWQDAG